MISDIADTRITELLDFWFDGDPAGSDRPERLMRKWFAATSDQDRELDSRFRAPADCAARGDLDSWARTPRGRLALILLLDQLPRSLDRGTAGAFAQDGKALHTCLEGLELAHDRALHPLERMFFYMPLQHAESLASQERSLTLFAELAESATSGPLRGILGASSDFALEHHAIIARFGRFPHRNKALDRESTRAELEFLESGGPTYGQ